MGMGASMMMNEAPEVGGPTATPAPAPPTTGQSNAPQTMTINMNEVEAVKNKIGEYTFHFVFLGDFLVFLRLFIYL